MDYKGIKIERIVHDSFEISFKSLVIYIDPFTNSRIDYAPYPKADFIFITHEHFDHCDLTAIGQLSKESTKIFGNKKVAEALSSMQISEVEPEKEYLLDNFSFTTVRAYNINKFRSPGQPFHPKENHGLGYIFDINGTKIYHTGDTDAIPEQETLTGLDILLIPISGTYVMTATEAADLVKKIKPKIAFPMHYGSIVGGNKELEEFKKLVGNEAQIIEK